MKLVSVVIVSYNSKKTIIDTLESVKKQDYEKIELIVSDDCSKDDTVEIVKKWIADNNSSFVNTKVICAERNGGLPKNLNRGLLEATGDYVKFLAADDVMLEDAISRYVDFCELHDNMLPIAKVKIIAEDNSDISSVEKYCENCYELAAKRLEEQYKRMLMSNWIVAPAADFFPIQIIRSFNGYNEAYRWMEDYPMNLKLLKNGYQFGLIDKPLMIYRVSGDNITSSHSFELKKTEMKVFFQQKMWYMIQAGLGWEAIKQSRYWIKVLFMRKV